MAGTVPMSMYEAPELIHAATADVKRIITEPQYAQPNAPPPPPLEECKKCHQSECKAPAPRRPTAPKPTSVGGKKRKRKTVRKSKKSKSVRKHKKTGKKHAKRHSKTMKRKGKQHHKRTKKHHKKSRK